MNNPPLPEPPPQVPCYGCGKPIDDGIGFCPSCWSLIEEEANQFRPPTGALTAEEHDLLSRQWTDEELERFFDDGSTSYPDRPLSAEEEEEVTDQVWRYLLSSPFLTADEEEDASAGFSDSPFGSLPPAPKRRVATHGVGSGRHIGVGASFVDKVKSVARQVVGVRLDSLRMVRPADSSDESRLAAALHNLLVFVRQVTVRGATPDAAEISYSDLTSASESLMVLAGRDKPDRLRRTGG